MTETAGPTMGKFPGNIDSASLGINLNMKKWLPGERRLDPKEKKKKSLLVGGRGGRLSEKELVFLQMLYI